MTFIMILSLIAQIVTWWAFIKVCSRPEPNWRIAVGLAIQGIILAFMTGGLTERWIVAG